MDNKKILFWIVYICSKIRPNENSKKKQTWDVNGLKSSAQKTAAEKTHTKISAQLFDNRLSECMWVLQWTHVSKEHVRHVLNQDFHTVGHFEPKAFSNEHFQR